MVKLIDTAGQEEYERVRKLFYKEANCFILCYDVSNRTSYMNITQKWIPELKEIDRWPIPIVLVGKKFCFSHYRRRKHPFASSLLATKTDLRRNTHKPMVSTEEGEDLSRRIYANRFIECSAKENHHIQDAIHEAVRASIKGAIVVERKEKARRNTRQVCSSCCPSWINCLILKSLLRTLQKLFEDFN